MAISINLIAINFTPVNFKTKIVCITNFSFANIKFHYAKSCTKVCIVAVCINVIDRLVFGYESIVIFREISNLIIIDVHEVNISIRINNNKTLGTLIVSDMRNIAIAEIIYFTECLDALVVLIIDIETIGSLYKYKVSSLFYFLHIMICHIGFPVSNGCLRMEYYYLNYQE